MVRMTSLYEYYLASHRNASFKRNHMGLRNLLLVADSYHMGLDYLVTKYVANHRIHKPICIISSLVPLIWTCVRTLWEIFRVDLAEGRVTRVHIVLFWWGDGMHICIEMMSIQWVRSNQRPQTTCAHFLVWSCLIMYCKYICLWLQSCNKSE